MKILSLFAGCGGLDLGFEQAGFHTAWANEYDKDIWDTYQHNHPHVALDRRSIRDIVSTEMPDDIVGMIGGPPCQSWSEAGAQRGIEDARGQLFYEYIRVLHDKRPLFFLAENVQGMLFAKNRSALHNILNMFEELGYVVRYKLLNTKEYGVPQDRKRVIFVGYHKRMGQAFRFPPSPLPYLTLRDAIGDLADSGVPALAKNYANETLVIPNHEYWVGGFSSMYMSRNRVRGWHEPSYTIQAGGRHAPLHPQANKMIKVGVDKRIFDPDSPHPYRRLSVRECARIQTFPDDFLFMYKNVAAGYKMIGNAVPPRFAKVLAEVIYRDVSGYLVGKMPAFNTHHPLDSSPKQLILL